MIKEILLITAFMLPAYAQAADMHMQHAPVKQVSGPSTQAYVAAMKTMHEDMDVVYTDNADINFVRGMIPHHKGAVDMVAVLMQYGKDPELRKLGERIALAQKLEIAEMRRWLETHDNKKLSATDNAMVKAYIATMEKMHKGMEISYSGDADMDFVRGMIPHHEGAIDMSWVLIRHGKDQMLLDMANDIIRSQQQEIAFMKKWMGNKH